MAAAILKRAGEDPLRLVGQGVSLGGADLGRGWEPGPGSLEAHLVVMLTAPIGHVKFRGVVNRSFSRGWARFQAQAVQFAAPDPCEFDETSR